MGSEGTTILWIMSEVPTLRLKKNLFKKAQELWNKVKADKNSYVAQVLDLKTEAAKAKGTMVSFWKKVVTQPPPKKSRKS